MKSRHFVVALATVVVVGGVVFAFMREAPTESSPNAAATGPTLASVTEAAVATTSDEAAPQAVHVDDLTVHPDDHTGPVLIRGIVAGVNQQENVVALIDAREFEACGTVACATNYLPVRVTGTLPEPLSLVQITGEVVKGTNGLEVRADALETVK